MNFKITYSVEQEPKNYSPYTYKDLKRGDVFVIPGHGSKVYIKCFFNYYVDLSSGKILLYRGDINLPVVIFKGEIEFNVNNFAAYSEF